MIRAGDDIAIATDDSSFDVLPAHAHVNLEITVEGLPVVVQIERGALRRYVGRVAEEARQNSAVKRQRWADRVAIGVQSAQICEPGLLCHRRDQQA